MTQPLEALDADMSSTGNVQELRPALDRAATAEPKPHAKLPARRRPQLRSLLLAGAAVALLAGGGWYGWDYWTTGRFLVSTDDAYVKADNTTVAPKVSGYIGEVLVADNQPVKAGQVLARIDDRDFRVALDQARADVSAAEAALASKRAQLDVQRSVITAAQATLDVDTANETFASQENKRYSDLAKTGFGSVQNAQQAQSRAASAAAVIARDTANLASAQRLLELSKAEIAQAVSQLRLAGVDGPYALLLGSAPYTAIGGATDDGYPVLQHIQRLVDGKIIWAPAIEGGVVLTTRGGDFSLTVGQDLSIGYLGHTATAVQLYFQESITFLMQTSEASVALAPADKAKPG